MSLKFSHPGARMPRAAVRKAAKPASKKPAATKTARKLVPSKLGALPEWNLADLYPSHDAPEVTRDLERADAASVAFEEAYKGKLAGFAAGTDAGPRLAEAVKRYEALDDLLGRLISVASLFYAGDTSARWS